MNKLNKSLMILIIMLSFGFASNVIATVASDVKQENLTVSLTLQDLKKELTALESKVKKGEVVTLEQLDGCAQKIKSLESRVNVIEAKELRAAKIRFIRNIFLVAIASGVVACCAADKFLNNAVYLKFLKEWCVNVYKNVAFGLRVAGLPTSKAIAAVVIGDGVVGEVVKGKFRSMFGRKA